MNATRFNMPMVRRIASKSFQNFQIFEELGGKCLAVEGSHGRIGLPGRLAKASIRRSGGGPSVVARQQRGSSGTIEPRSATRRQQLQHVTVLQLRSGHDAEHPLDESAAHFAVGSAAALAPQHGFEEFEEFWFSLALRSATSR